MKIIVVQPQVQTFLRKCLLKIIGCVYEIEIDLKVDFVNFFKIYSTRLGEPV